jgi:hypothetical protein
VKSLQATNSLIEKCGRSFPFMATELTVHADQKIASINDIL